MKKEIDHLGRTIAIHPADDGAEIRMIAPPGVEWESNPIRTEPTESLMIRGVVRDFDGEDRIDDAPAALFELDGCVIIPAPIVAGMVAAELRSTRLMMRGTHRLRLHCTPFAPEDLLIEVR